MKQAERGGGGRPEPLPVQVDPIQLILHGGATTVLTHLERDQPSFSEQMPKVAVQKPEEQFALLNVLAQMIEAMRKVDPTKPETVVLQAVKNNFVTGQTEPALAKGNTPIPPQNPADFQTPQFNEAMNTLVKKYQTDAPKRDAVACVGAAAQGRPLTGTEVFNVLQNLGEGLQITPEMWQRVMQHLINAVKLMKNDADGMNKRMGEMGKPTMMDMANVVREGMDVGADGAITPRAGAPATQKPDEAMGLLETYRDFWMALMKAGQERKLTNETQRQIAQLLRHTGAKYVRTGRNDNAAAMQGATEVDARAMRFLIQKLKASPMMKADKAKMAALEKLVEAEERKKPLSPQELLEVFDQLGKGVKLAPDMLRVILEHMITQARGVKPTPQELAPAQRLIASGAPVLPADAIRAISKATVQKPEQRMAVLELFTNFFLAMAATKQNEAMRDHCQRMMAETLQGVSQLYGTQYTKRPPPAQVRPIDINAYRMMLMKLRAERQIKADPSKARALEELAAAQATGKAPSPQQLLEIYKDLGRGVPMTSEMLRVILEFMVTEMRAMTNNEKAEVQKRYKNACKFDTTDIVNEAGQVRNEQAEIQQQGQMVGCFQVFPQGHPAFAHRPAPFVSRSREVGMRAGPASVDWHRYQALGTQPPEEEMARVILVQNQLADVSKFDDERTQKTLMKEAGDVTFRSILQPTVMERYQQSLKKDKAALSALQSLSKVGTMDDQQLEKRVGALLTTLFLNRAQLQAVLKQLVRDRLMTNNEAKDLERHCEPKMAASGGKMKLSELQDLIRARKAG